MIELKKEFTGKGEVKGFKFTQKKATDKAYLYQVEDNGRFYYEVFKKRINTRFESPRVSYPTGKAFGVWAWCIRDFSRAIEKFNELNKGGK